MRAYFAQLETSRQAKAAENLTTLLKTGASGIGDSGRSIRSWRHAKNFFANFAGILIEYAQISLDNDKAM